MLKRLAAFASASATAATIASLGSALPVHAEGAQFPNTDAPCMGGWQKHRTPMRAAVTSH